MTSLSSKPFLSASFQPPVFACVCSFEPEREREMGACATKPRNDDMEPPKTQPSMEGVGALTTVTSSTIVQEEQAGGGGGEGRNEVGREVKPKVWFQDEPRRRSLGRLFVENNESKKSTMDKSTSDSELLEKPQVDVAVTEAKDSDDTPSNKRSKEVGAQLPEIERSMKSVHEKSSVNEKVSEDAELKVVGVETTMKSIQVEIVAEKSSPEDQKKAVKEEHSVSVTSLTETNVKAVEAITVEKSTHIEGISVSKDSGKDTGVTVGSVEKLGSQEGVIASVKGMEYETLVIQKKGVIQDVKIEGEFKQQLRAEEQVEASAQDVKSETVVSEKKNAEQYVKIEEESKLRSDATEEVTVSEPVREPNVAANADARQQVSIENV